MEHILIEYYYSLCKIYYYKLEEIYLMFIKMISVKMLLLLYALYVFFFLTLIYMEMEIVYHRNTKVAPYEGKERKLAFYYIFSVLYYLLNYDISYRECKE